MLCQDDIQARSPGPLYQLVSMPSRLSRARRVCTALSASGPIPNSSFGRFESAVGVGVVEMALAVAVIVVVRVVVAVRLAGSGLATAVAGMSVVVGMGLVVAVDVQDGIADGGGKAAGEPWPQLKLMVVSARGSVRFVKPAASKVSPRNLVPVSDATACAACGSSSDRAATQRAMSNNTAIPILGIDISDLNKRQQHATSSMLRPD